MEVQIQPGLLAGKTRQTRKKLSLPFGIQPLTVLKLVVVASTQGGHPNFMQGLLQVDDDLRSVGKHQGHHAAAALIVDIRIGFIIDAIAADLDMLQSCLSTVHELRVGHYNFVMLKTLFILGRTLLCLAAMLSLWACGQTGALYLPKPVGAQASAGATNPGGDVSSTEKPKGNGATTQNR